jgi:hypothetical protein
MAVIGWMPVQNKSRVASMLRLMGASLAVPTLLFSTPASATTAIYYSDTSGSYGWCAGYSHDRSHSCAKDWCVKGGGTDCRPVVECNGGWGAVALSGYPVNGFGASCGMGDAITARGVALAECIVASKTICWTAALFAGSGSAQPDTERHQADVVYYSQTLLQMLKSKLKA